VGGRRAHDPPKLAEVEGILRMPKRPGCTEEAWLRRPIEFGQRAERWTVEGERKKGMIMARLVVGDQPVLGLDWHQTSVRGAEGIFPPNSYHWDVAYPFPACRIWIACAKPGHDADRLALDLLVSCWHISFDTDPTGDRLV